MHRPSIQPGEDTRIFTIADFEQFAPRTALDMVSQIPGFSAFLAAIPSQRGFGQAQENVLINGQRISSKSTSASDALARIPAENVETHRDSSEGANLDIPGLSGQVANVDRQGQWNHRHLDLSPALSGKPAAGLSNGVKYHGQRTERHRWPGRSAWTCGTGARDGQWPREYFRWGRNSDRVPRRRRPLHRRGHRHQWQPELDPLKTGISPI